MNVLVMRAAAFVVGSAIAGCVYATHATAPPSASAGKPATGKPAIYRKVIIRSGHVTVERGEQQPKSQAAGGPRHALTAAARSGILVSNN